MKKLLVTIALLSLIMVVIFILQSVKLVSNEEIKEKFESNLDYYERVIQEVLSDSEDHFLEDTTNQTIRKFLVDHKYFQVSKSSEGVYLIKETSFGFSKGLYYSLNGSEPTSDYITYIHHILDKWYLYNMK